MDRLLVAVLGDRDAGKSHTWNTLFGTTVRTGKYVRPLEVAEGRLVDVFLASGSPQERELYVGDIVADADARIVLCSIQYTQEAKDSFDYFIARGFTLVVQWLNPGYNNASRGPDYLGIVTWLQFQHSLVAIRDGQIDAQSRVEELRQTIHGWAAARDLVYMV